MSFKLKIKNKNYSLFNWYSILISQILLIGLIIYLGENINKIDDNLFKLINSYLEKYLE